MSTRDFRERTAMVGIRRIFRRGVTPAAIPTYQTSPARQSHIKSAEVSKLTSTGRTNRVPSSSGVRVGPVGVSTDVGPRHGDHPRAVYILRARADELTAPN
jgi:hypothetical protein